MLSLNAGATKQDIKRAYSKLARIIHPNRGGDPGAFQDLKTAVDVLLDPELRRIYDTDGHDGLDEHFRGLIPGTYA